MAEDITSMNHHIKDEKGESQKIKLTPYEWLVIKALNEISENLRRIRHG
jgi:hypothetical protein